MSEDNDFRPNWATHPGDHLAEYMEVTEMDLDALHTSTGIPKDKLIAILDPTQARGKRAPVTEAEAEAFEKVFGLAAHIWLGLQRGWDEHMAAKARADTRPDGRLR